MQLRTFLIIFKNYRKKARIKKEWKKHLERIRRLAEPKKVYYYEEV